MSCVMHSARLPWATESMPICEPSVIRLGSWVELGAEAYAIRHEVFVREQGVPVELERDEHDATALHILLTGQDGLPIATGRLLPDGHVGRIAVRAAYRRQGYGQRIMRALIDEANRRGHTELLLHAQTEAETFYAGLGFEKLGAVFMEAGIPHVAMHMLLS
jgi:predicted GNAT family N-acyltransferase